MKDMRLKMFEIVDASMKALDNELSDMIEASGANENEITALNISIRALVHQLAFDNFAGILWTVKKAGEVEAISEDKVNRLLNDAVAYALNQINTSLKRQDLPFEFTVRRKQPNDN